MTDLGSLDAPEALPAPPRRSIARTALLLLPMQVVFRGGEALLPVLLARWFGGNTGTDVYYFSLAVFMFAGSLVFSAYQDSALVPILAEVKRKDPSLVPVVTGSLLAHTLAWGGGLAVAIGAVALGWFGIHYSGPDFVLAAKMVLPFALFLVALSVRTFFVAILNADHRFFAYPVSSCVGVVTTIGLIAATRGRLGVLAIPTASLAGELAAIAVLAWITFGACKMKMHLSFARPAPVIRFVRLISSEVGGGAVTRVNPVVDQLMAGLAWVVGGPTLLFYSNAVASVPTSLLQATLLPVLLSHLADDFAAGRIERIRATVRRSLLVVSAILIAASALLFFVRAPLLRFVFLGQRMDAAGVDWMIRILPYHLVGLAPFGALLILARAHVATKNSGIMISMGILNAALNAFFNVVLLAVMGLPGIALSTSCVQLAVAVVFWFRLEKHLDTAAKAERALTS